MSGICGAVAAPGAAIEPGLVQRMTTWLTRYAPDGRATWSDERAGLGHALLDTTDGRVRDLQPCTLDGRAWITADARLDGRRELVDTLTAAGEAVAPGTTDAGLILHAWRAWGEACVEHLLGDFAFAVWDRPQGTLFCARDQLGVKGFFYAQPRGALVFASAIACLRSEAELPGGLDELAIADFLLFERSRDEGATSFAAIRRLPPAHCLVFSDSGLRMRRYWQLAPAPLTIARGEDFPGRFDELLRRAVADRSTSARVSVLMSGGLDSPALAAAAREAGADVKAFSSVYDRIFPDDERHFSTLAARAIGIPIRHLAADDYGLFDRYRELDAYFAEPVNAPFAASDVDLAAAAASHSRVAFTGWDGDAVLEESPRPYLAGLSARGEWLALGASFVRYVLDHPRPSARSLWLRLRRRARVTPEPPYFPPWLNADFATRLRLRERWDDEMHAAIAGDALRPYAHLTFHRLAQLSNFFEATEPARTGCLVEMRHPFFDLRVVEFCLSLPTVPWCIRKEILRRWLRGRVPEAVRTRPKTPLAGFPHLLAPPRPGRHGRGRFEPCEEASQYVDRGKMMEMEADAHPWRSWVDLRPASLDLWLRHARAA
jgi:asparagine synthase (glutamine-hydrolysing)